MAANLDALLRIRSDVQGANQIVALNRGLQGVERTATPGPAWRCGDCRPRWAA